VRSRVRAVARVALAGRQGPFGVTASPVSRGSCFGQPPKTGAHANVLWGLFVFFCLLFKEARSFSWDGERKRTEKSACTLR